jgi:hypothetical protein
MKTRFITKKSNQMLNLSNLFRNSQLPADSPTVRQSDSKIFGYRHLQFFFLLALITGCMFYLACKKEPSGNGGINFAQTFLRDEGFNPFTSIKISVHQGLLKFADVETYESYQDYWKIANDSIFLQNLKGQFPEYFVVIPEEQIVDGGPVYLKIFEDLRGFSSLRKAEELKLTNLLLSGGEPSTYGQIRHFVLDPFRQSFLNEQAEFMIGNVIVKYFDQQNTVYILDGDFSKLEIVRDQKVQGLPPSNAINVRVVNCLNPEIINDVFNFGQDGHLIATKPLLCQANFSLTMGGIANSSVFLLVRNTSIVSSPSIYSLKVNNVAISTPSGGIPWIISYSNITWPLTLRLTIDGPDEDCFFEKTYSSPCDMFEISGIRVASGTGSGNVVTVNTNLSMPDATYTWSWGDGTSNIISTVNTMSHTYTNVSVYDYYQYPISVTINIPNWNGGSCSKTATGVGTTCGRTYGYISYEAFSPTNRYRLNGVGSVTLLEGNKLSFFCEVRSFKKVGGFYWRNWFNPLSYRIRGICYLNCQTTLVGITGVPNAVTSWEFNGPGRHQGTGNSIVPPPYLIGSYPRFLPNQIYCQWGGTTGDGTWTCDSGRLYFQ